MTRCSGEKKERNNLPLSPKKLVWDKTQALHSLLPFERQFSSGSKFSCLLLAASLSIKIFKATAALSSVQFGESAPSLCGRNDWKGYPQAKHPKLGLHFLISQQGQREQELGISAQKPASKYNPPSDLLILSPQTG